MTEVPKKSEPTFVVKKPDFRIERGKGAEVERVTGVRKTKLKNVHDNDQYAQP